MASSKAVEDLPVVVLARIPVCVLSNEADLTHGRRRIMADSSARWAIVVS
ncbi:hypothetical protein QCM77_32455 [Bradyrhizobium sp. SSUT18]|nr:hypothetical protein [Bradyrhizobium sp. SSUT18]MDH2404622.1 hypothetical protein [Bradyrhizobium sp. SSUT18]